ncbi:PH domain-containing protein [Microbacterium sp. NE1TT3]|uniref:PH domain-containing protein n=1 Tax=Microbacterium thalli TaxID=3027921 RepID=A0ABT5SGX3_9MICO|nr:PH domain-containing protein [Microbacterium thalli]MDD7961143.1 PH domain-containing protein [Microbacterium thalli]
MRSPLSDGEWHRLHPLTPLLRGGLALLVVLGIVVANMRDRLIGIFVPAFGPGGATEEWEEYEAAGDPIGWVLANNLILIALLVTVGALALIVGGFYLSWRFHTFRITEDDVEVRSGILSRTQRRAPLDRVQGVNLTRPAVARLLGAAKLEIVGAGADANVKLEYLSTSNAETIRADILRLASGQRLAEARAAAAANAARSGVTDTVARGLTGLIEGDDADAAEPASVVRIPPGRLVGSQLASWGTVVILAGATALTIAVAQSVFWVIFAYLPALLGLGAYWVRTIVRSLRYSIAPTRDGVRVTFGLLTTVSEILPPGRIHAIEVTQPIFWRAFGWWAVRINRMTGRSATDTTTDQFTTVLPVGTLADVDRVLGLILPAVAEADRAAIIRQGVLGSRDADAPGDGYVTTPRRARILRPLSWRRNGLAIGTDLLLLRRGLLWRRLAMVPLARLQSIGLQQGPLDRALRVATLRAHTVAGPVVASVTGIDRDDAIAAFERVAAVAVSAAATDRTHRWAASDGVVEAGIPAVSANVPPPPPSSYAPPAGVVPPPPYVPPVPPPSPYAAPSAVTPPPPYVPPVASPEEER